MASNWIENDVVESCLCAGDLTPLNAKNIEFCVSEDGTCCAFLREHATWQIDGEWHDGNYPPDSGGVGRFALNFTRLASEDEGGFWFKVLIPDSIRSPRLSSVGEDEFVLHHSGGELRQRFDALGSIMWAVLSGDSQSETEIAESFESVWIQRRT